MILNMIGPFVANAPFGSEIAFAKGLRQLGFKDGVDLFCVDPNIDSSLSGMNVDATATIVFKSCIGNEEQLKRLKGQVITYQPDDARFPHIRQMMMLMRGYSDLFLSFDRHGAEVARAMGYRAAEELLLTADSDLYCRAPEKERDIDISFIGSLHGPQSHASRRKMCQLASEYATHRDLECVFAETYDLPTLIDIYQRSKVVLNHATDVGQQFGQGFGLQCRHFEVGMTGTCLLSNSDMSHITLNDQWWYPSFSDEESFISMLDMLLTKTTNDPRIPALPMWKFLGETIYNTIQEKHMPVHRAGQLVNFVQRHVIG